MCPWYAELDVIKRAADQHTQADEGCCWGDRGNHVNFGAVKKARPVSAACRVQAGGTGA